MAPIPSDVARTVEWFSRIYLAGIPALLRSNDTSFLSFVCVVAATDALAGYRYTDPKVGDRFKKFVENYFPPVYKPHAHKLYLLRCRLLHNFSPAYFSLTHAAPGSHLKPSSIGDTVLSDNELFLAIKVAAEKYFTELQSSAQLQTDMIARLNNLQEGGAIHVSA